MTDMVDGLILEGGLGLTGNVNKLKVCRDSPGESSGEQLRSLLSVQSVQLDAGERKTRLTRCGGGGKHSKRLNYVSVCGKKQNEGASVGQFAHEQVTNLQVSFCSTFLFSNPTDPHSQDTAVTLCCSLTDTFNN